MTDAEIIKNLENLTNVKIKFGKRRITVVEIDLLEDALALILRQQERMDRIVEQLESEIKWMKMLVSETCSLEAESHLCGLNKVIDIVKGVQNE